MSTLKKETGKRDQRIWPWNLHLAFEQAGAPVTPDSARIAMLEDLVLETSLWLAAAAAQCDEVRTRRLLEDRQRYLAEGLELLARELGIEVPDFYEFNIPALEDFKPRPHFPSLAEIARQPDDNDLSRPLNGCCAAAVGKGAEQ